MLLAGVLVKNLVEHELKLLVLPSTTLALALALDKDLLVVAVRGHRHALVAVQGVRGLELLLQQLFGLKRPAADVHGDLSALGPAAAVASLSLALAPSLSVLGWGQGRRCRFAPETSSIRYTRS